jgi:hypothetical protein
VLKPVQQTVYYVNGLPLLVVVSDNINCKWLIVELAEVEEAPFRGKEKEHAIVVYILSVLDLLVMHQLRFLMVRIQKWQ